METLPPPTRPGAIAIYVAAWRESAVIGPMLRRALDTIRHTDTILYIGTYPNDPATAGAVRTMADDRVRLVCGTRPGPATKAECLNRVWQAMCADEIRDAAASRRSCFMMPKTSSTPTSRHCTIG